MKGKTRNPEPEARNPEPETRNPNSVNDRQDDAEVEVRRAEEKQRRDNARRAIPVNIGRFSDC